MTDEFLQNLWEKYRVPVHIRAHMEKVSAVCLFVGQKIQAAGGRIDLVKLRHAALLHDILKLCDFCELNLQFFNQIYTAEDIQFWNALIRSCSRIGHIQAFYNLLIEIGEKELAEIIKKHDFSCLIKPEECPRSWEEKILYYADKRVKHDQVVSIAERLIDGRKRYFPDGNLPPYDHLVEKALYRLESELCVKSGLLPEDINEETVLPFVKQDFAGFPGSPKN